MLKQEKYKELIKSLQEKYPKPVLYKQIDVSKYQPTYFRFGNFRGKGEKDFLLVRIRGYCLEMMAALSLEGEVLWEREFNKNYLWKSYGAVMPNPKTIDIDGDGIDEIICLYEGKIGIIDGSTGRTKTERMLFNNGPLFGAHNSLAAPDMNIYIANLRGTPIPSDIVVKDSDSGGGSTVWALDNELNLIWTYQQRQPLHGHHFNFWDIDGDGKEEVLAGYTMIDHDGKEIWRMEDCENTYRFAYARHVDSEAIGEFDGDESNGPEVAMVCGSEGFILLDGRTGKIRRQHIIGHAQGITVGKFRKDIEGLQMWVGTRWGNFGIMVLFDGKGDVLYRFQPDFYTQGGPPVNWSGDGEELLLLLTPSDAFGLYDAYGRKIFGFDNKLSRSDSFNAWPIAWAKDIIGDERDEIIYGNKNYINIYTQDEPFRGERIYAPIRRERFEIPWVSFPRWKKLHT
ncbi:MAG TPA: hypothetical protein GXX37_07220 [Clostridiaceae bacterium]|nr:hypothetical protein [Clostridiaceae bacterium]